MDHLLDLFDCDHVLTELDHFTVQLNFHMP